MKVQKKANGVIHQRRQRTKFTEEQTALLNAQFIRKNSLDPETIDALVTKTKLNASIIRRWFSNRRQESARKAANNIQAQLIKDESKTFNVLQQVVIPSFMQQFVDNNNKNVRLLTINRLRQSNNATATSAATFTNEQIYLLLPESINTLKLDFLVPAYNNNQTFLGNMYLNLPKITTTTATITSKQQQQQEQQQQNATTSLRLAVDCPNNAEPIKLASAEFQCSANGIEQTRTPTPTQIELNEAEQQSLDEIVAELHKGNKIDVNRIADAAAALMDEQNSINKLANIESTGAAAVEAAEVMNNVREKVQVLSVIDYPNIAAMPGALQVVAKESLNKFELLHSHSPLPSPSLGFAEFETFNAIDDSTALIAETNANTNTNSNTNTNTDWLSNENDLNEIFKYFETEDGFNVAKQEEQETKQLLAYEPEPNLPEILMSYNL